MIEFLLPERLRPKNGLTDAEVGGGLVRGFEDARVLLRGAAWASAPIGLLTLVSSVFSMEVYDRVIGRQALSTLIAMLAGVLVALALEAWLRRRRSTQFREAGAIMDWALQGELLERMFKHPLRQLEDRPAPQWVQLFRDAASVRVLLTGSIVQSIFDLPVAILALIIIAIVALPLLPIVLLGLLVFGLMAWWWADEVKTGKVKELQRARSLDALTAEICRARESIKSLSQQGPVVGQWRAQYEHWLSESFGKGAEHDQARELSTTMMSVVTISLTAFGAYAVINQWMTVGGMIATNMLASKAIAPISNLAGSWRQLSQALEAARRLRGVFEEPVEVPKGDVDLPRPNGRMALEEVTFRFSKSTDPILENVSVTLEPQQFHVIVGRNGAGKTTLLKLLAGLYRPEHGRVLLGEYDLQQFSREETSNWLGILSQNVYFLDGTIVEQLRRVAPEATDDQLVRACQLAGAHDFITKLPRGYNTMLREGGRALSGGERRKIALAQVLLRNPVVLLLDEPTNDLDHESELRLIAALKSIARVRMVVAITHSARMVANADVALAVTGRGQITRMSVDDAMARYFGSSVRAPGAPAAPDEAAASTLAATADPSAGPAA